MKDASPVISCRLPPSRTLKKKFIFPPSMDDIDLDQEPEQNIEEDDSTPTLASSQTTFENNILFEGFETLSNHIVPDINEGHATGPSTLSQGTTALIPSSSSSSGSSFSPLSSTTSLVLPETPLSVHQNPNPYPFPPWYPESAHFVRQWWPTLPNIPRVSCTVVLLAAHDQIIHRTRFVLAQHYFRVPLDRREWENGYERPLSSATIKGAANGKQESDGRTVTNDSSHLHSQPSFEESQDDALMHLWYVSTPFDVVRVLDGLEEEEDGALERPRPLVAVDFGHAVWIEYIDDEEEEEDDRGDEDVLEDRVRPNGTIREEEESTMDIWGNVGPVESSTESSSQIDREPKRLRFVTFPPFVEDFESTSVVSNNHKAPVSSSLSTSTFTVNRKHVNRQPGVVYTLVTPPTLQLGSVETINIDQSQGAVILSDKLGKIWILCYE